MPATSITGKSARAAVAAVAVLLAASAVRAAETAERPARAWIEALGQGEGTLVQGESPKRWLAQHLDAAYPDLLAALDDPNPQIAKAALAFLDQAPARPDLVPGLLRIAADPEHPLFAEATYALCRFAGDARVRKLLAKALANPADFSDAFERARFAEALGDRKRAVAMLVPFLRSDRERDVVATIARLESIGYPSAVGPLARLTRDRRWEVVRAASLALAELDPKGHGLRASQRELLQIARSRPDERGERTRSLAALPRAEVRPLLLAMLGSDARADALEVLARWKDRAVLPQLRALLGRRGDPRIDDVVRAYLSLDDSKAAADQIVRVAVTAPTDLACVAVVRGVAAAASERRGYLLGQIRKSIGSKWPDAIPRGLRQTQADLAPVLGPLLEAETDLRALGLYAELVARQPSKSHEIGVRRALALLRSKGAAEMLGEPAKSAGAVLDASIALGLADLDAELAPMLTAPDRQLRRQAACAAAVQRDGASALAHVYAELGGERHDWATACLLKLPCPVADRARREAALRGLVGGPAEGLALRALLTCAGPGTVATVSALVLDRMLADGVAQPVPQGQEWPRRAYYDALLADLAGSDGLGPQLAAEVRAQANQRGLSLPLRAAGLRLWRE